jgi:hypothetical protein
VSFYGADVLPITLQGKVARSNTLHMPAVPNTEVKQNWVRLVPEWVTPALTGGTVGAVG